MNSLQMGSPAAEVFCFPLTATPFQKTQLADLQNIFSIISTLIIDSVPWGKGPWMYPFLLSSICCVSPGILSSFDFIFLSHTWIT